MACTCKVAELEFDGIGRRYGDFVHIKDHVRFSINEKKLATFTSRV